MQYLGYGVGMGGADLAFKRSDPGGAGFDKHLVFSTMPYFIVFSTMPYFTLPTVYRVHLRQNVYTRGQFFLQPGLRLLPGPIEIGP